MGLARGLYERAKKLRTRFSRSKTPQKEVVARVANLEASVAALELWVDEKGCELLAKAESALYAPTETAKIPTE